MERPCESSWTGAHEYFQAREYDAGASTATSEHGTTPTHFGTRSKEFKLF